MPAVLGGLRTKGWLEGPVYNTLALGGYFLFGFAFLLLMLLLFRDFVWAVSYGLAKLSGHASAGWSPVNTVALTKANLITLALALLLSLYALYEGVKTPRVREIVIETSKQTGKLNPADQRHAHRPQQTGQMVRRYGGSGQRSGS